MLGRIPIYEAQANIQQTQSIWRWRWTVAFRPVPSGLPEANPQVRSRLGRDPFAADAVRTIEASIDATGGLWHVELSARDADGPVQGRRVFDVRAAVTVVILVPKWRQIATPNGAERTINIGSVPKGTRQNLEAPALNKPEESPAVPKAMTSNAGTNATNAAKAVPVASANSMDDLRREIQLLERARRLISVDPSRALYTLDEHQREFGNGTLVLERQFLEVEALLRLGRRGEARARAAALRANAPGSLYERRLAQLLDGASE